jgi:5-methylcytosine-specific restriction endonuclease McrA
MKIQGDGYCHKHYEAMIIRGGYKLHFCAYPNCKFKTHKQYCNYHLVLYKRLNKPKGFTMKEANNPNWRGGTSDYPNHTLMKKNRILKLQQTEGLCEICKKQGEQIHHKDGSKDNHNIENLILLCHKCHIIIHSGRQNKTSKFIRLYGMTMQSMAEKWGGHIGKYYYLHKKNLLKDFLKRHS